jgi:elongation factor P
MAKINGSEIRPGMVIEYDGSLWMAVKTVAVKPGPAFNQVELKKHHRRPQAQPTLRQRRTVEQVHVERKDFQFLYRQGDQFVFMNADTYEQIELAEDFVGERAAFLQDGMTVNVQMHQDRAIGIRLPEHVVLEVLEADAVLKGQNAASSYKPARLENALRLMVPPFITAGEKVVVNTNEVSYVRRAE